MNPRNEMPTTRLQFLDSARGLAALAVLLFHLAAIPSLNVPVPNSLTIVRMGSAGVFMFFIISGFSLCLTMPRHIQTGMWIKSFFVHRFFRLAPLFYALLFYNIVFSLSKGVAISWVNMGLNFSLLFNLIPGFQFSMVAAGWTIGVEIIMYLLFPFCYTYANELFKSTVLFILAVLLSFFASKIIPEAFFEHNILRHFPLFILGIIVFYASIYLTQIQHRFRICLGVVFLGAGVYSFLLQIRGYMLTFGANQFWESLKGVIAIPYPLIHVGLSISLALVLAGLFLVPVWGIVSRATAFLGKISYSFYLLHMLVVTGLAEVYPIIASTEYPPMLQYIMCVGITLAVLIPLSFFTFYFIERPGINIGKYIMQSLQKKYNMNSGVQCHGATLSA